MDFSVVWNYWLVVAFVAPMLWAVVNIIDVYFVGNVFDDEFDGIAIMGLFQIFPWAFVFFVKPTFPSDYIVALALLAGIFYIFAMFFYFKALFAANDAAVVSIFWNISILLLPLITFFVFNERLTIPQYGGLVIAFIGASLVSTHNKIKERNLSKVFTIMMASVVFLSASMAISDHVYEKTDFLSGFLLFSLGAFMGGLFFALMRLKLAKKINRLTIFQLNKKYFFWFLGAEIFTLLGIGFSQRAIAQSPSVSFVAAIESMQVLFILIFSAIMFVLLSFVMQNKKQEVTKLIYKEQLVGYWVKILASVIIALGIYFINQG